MLRSRRFRTVALGGAAACLALCVPAAHAATGTGAVAHDPDVAQLEAAGRAVGQADAGVAALAQAPGTPGAPGVGDPYFPLLGNGGFNVRHYDLTFSYDPGSDQIDATMVVQARATQKLSRLDLDLQQLFVRRVRVDGKRAGFARDGQELQITPSRPLRDDHRFTIEVDYGGQPQTIVGSPIVFGSPYGFLHTEDGAFMGDEPNAASTWMPVSDHPSDKATWTFRVTVPAGKAVIANGRLVSQDTRRGARSCGTSPTPWRPISPTADIGDWIIKTGTTPRGIPVTVAVDPVAAPDRPSTPPTTRSGRSSSPTRSATRCSRAPCTAAGR